MARFRRLVAAALLSGAVAGLALFALQHWTVAPLIEAAEAYETAAPHAEAAEHGWQPADGIERTGLTAAATMLAGIGFAALLLAAMALSGRPVGLRNGVLWGLAGFACFALAPALGILPRPPGAAVAELAPRQLWWAGTAAATALGLWVVVRYRRVPKLVLAGVALLILPHAIGAPAAAGANLVPHALMRDFAIASLATNACFWLLLGALGGFLYARLDRDGRRA